MMLLSIFIFSITVFNVIPFSFDMTSISIINDDQPNSFLRQLNVTHLQSFDRLYHIMAIEVCIGRPHQCFKMLYDTGMMYTILSDTLPKAKFAKSFNSSLSQTIRNPTNKNNLIALTYRTGTMKTREVIDYVSIGNMLPLKGFNFLLTFETSEEFTFDGILGLGRLYPQINAMTEHVNQGDNFGQDNYFDRRFSFIDYLYDNKLIQRRMFGHEYINRTHGKFYIDEIPQSLGNNFFYCKNEPFIPYLLRWHCEMRSLSLSTGENYTEISSPVVFDSGFVNIRGPKSEGSIIFNHFLTISGKDCHIEEKGFYQKFLCNGDFNLKRFPHLHFNLKGMQMTLFNEDMFRRIERNNRQYLISKIIIDWKVKYWELGEPVLKNYNMLFDYDKDIVGITPNINFEGDSWISVIILSIILMIIIIIMIWLVINRKKLLAKRFSASTILINKVNETELSPSGKMLQT